MILLEEDIKDIQRKLKNEEYPNEQAISQGVVLRLLAAMDWNIYDTQSVIPEYQVQGKRVDFALCEKRDNPGIFPAIFIEVKQPGKALGADEQLFGYAFHEGVQFAILTDGKEWHFYLPAAKGSYEKRKVYKLDLVERDVSESLERLRRYLSFDEVASGAALENAQQDHKNLQIQKQAEDSIPKAWGKLIEEKEEMLIDLVSKQTESICGFKPEREKVLAYLQSLQARRQEVPTKPHSITHPTNKSKTRRKIKVTFPDGDEIFHNVATATFVETIKKIGAEKVRSLNIQQAGYPLISEQKYKGKGQWHDVGSGIYANTTSSTPAKHQYLLKINRELRLELEIVLE